MQFLRTLLVALTVGFAVAFAINNWTMVPLRIWGGMILEINLPLLLLVTFLAGLLPMWVAFTTLRWRMRQRVDVAERAIADIRAATGPAAPLAPDPVPVIVTDATPVIVNDAPPLMTEQRP